MKDRRHRLTWRSMVGGVIAFLALSACAPAASPPPAEETGPPATQTGAAAEEPLPLTAGFVGAIDQIGLPAALDQGYFEEHGLQVDIRDPYATGVDMLNALEAGEINVAQVGVPAIGAILEGMDLFLLGNYTGSAVQLGIDETMAVVAGEDSGIDPDDLSSLNGKSIGVSIGSINHLYVLALLEEAGVDPGSVELVNTPPPEMAVALQTAGVDAIAIWDPWPIIALRDVPGSFEVTRGGGRIAFIGYIVAVRDWVEQNPDAIERFLAARAQADQWIRQNPNDAAQVATRWLPGTDVEIAEQAMEFNIRQLDPRFSACNYAALHRAQELLNEVGAIDGTFDVNERFEPQYILNVMEAQPEYFEDLPDIPEEAQISPDYTFDPAADQCPES
jgi:ABC-type nitrate/sulfonate/bicarbonate transport system substrate-binding protein